MRLIIVIHMYFLVLIIGLSLKFIVNFIPIGLLDFLDIFKPGTAASTYLFT